jgi:nucleotide-binding universal stress UspA family protein
MKVLLKEQHSDNIDLIMRTGEIIEQLKDEVEVNKHDITIIGGGGNKGIHNKLIQFIDSAVFVVKNYSVSKKYKILLPVNDSKGSEKAIDTAINFAKSYKLTVEIVAVYEDKKSYEKTDKLLLRTKNMFLKNKINASTKILEGSTVNAIVDYAKDDSIIILGVSPKNPIMKYFLGSKPLSIAQKCNCPVLITK